LASGCGIRSIAQTNLNWKGYGDTATINAMKGTALFVSKAFNMTNAENKLLCVLFDDTVNTGRKTDTVYASVGYQLGSPLVNIAGSYDTIWTNFIPLDTIDSRTAAGKQYDPALGSTSMWTMGTDDLPVRIHGSIDTTLGTTSSGLWCGFSPYWSPLIRFYMKGITGNQATTYVKGKFVFIQRAYIKIGN
jgi:hypothetical protein